MPAARKIAADEKKAKRTMTPQMLENLAKAREKAMEVRASRTPEMIAQAKLMKKKNGDDEKLVVLQGKIDKIVSPDNVHAHDTIVCDTTSEDDMRMPDTTPEPEPEPELEPEPEPEPPVKKRKAKKKPIVIVDGSDSDSDDNNNVIYIRRKSKKPVAPQPSPAHEPEPVKATPAASVPPHICIRAWLWLCSLGAGLPHYETIGAKSDPSGIRFSRNSDRCRRAF